MLSVCQDAKSALNEAVKKLGYNKVAYAHHKDDIVETMILSLIFEGRSILSPPSPIWIGWV